MEDWFKFCDLLTIFELFWDTLLEFLTRTFSSRTFEFGFVVQVLDFSFVALKSWIYEWDYGFWIRVGRQTWHFCCSYDRFMCPNSALLFFLLIRVSNFFNRTSLTSLQMPLNPLWPPQTHSRVGEIYESSLI